MAATADKQPDDGWVDVLLEKMGEHPDIWDKSHRNYHVSTVKKKSWEAIADAIFEQCGHEIPGKDNIIGKVLGMYLWGVQAGGVGV